MKTAPEPKWRTIVRGVVRDILLAFDFIPTEDYDVMVDRCWRRSVELADARRAAERLFIERNVSREAAKRFREFVSEIAATTGPNAKKFGSLVHNLDRLHEAAMRVLKENRERDDV